MRRLILLCSGAGAIASATSAKAEGPYVGVEGGLYVQRPLAYNFVGLSNFFSTKYARGIDIAGKAGYDLEGVRIEGEIAYRRAPANQFGFSIDGQPLAVQKGGAVSGSLNTVSAMFNGYWDITQKRLRPYVGAGIGVARIESNKVGYSGFGDAGIFLDKAGIAFAYNFMAGFKARITRRVYANVGYKYTATPNFTLNVFNTSASTPTHSSSVLAGLSLSFGHSIVDEPPPPRPPVVLPATAEDLPATAPAGTSFNIFFVSGSNALIEDANITLDHVAAAYRNAGRATVMVLNIKAGSKLAFYDEPLAIRRAAAVRNGLIDRGVPSANVIVQSFDTPATKPLDTVARPIAFVMITFGPGSGE